MVSPKYTPVTQLPPSAQSLAPLMKSFRTYAGLSQSDYANLSEDLSAGVTGCVPISIHDIRQYPNNVLPSSTKRNTLILIFETVCDEQVKRLWIEAYADIEYQTKIKREKNHKKIDNHQTIVEKFIKKNEQEIQWKNKTLVFKIFLILMMLILLSWFYLSYIKTNDLPINNQSSKKDNYIDKLESTEPVKTANIQSNEPFMALAKGLLLDVYSLGKNKYKHLPSTPEGLQVATLPFNNGGYFTFIDHTTDQNILNATIDRDVGLYYQGFINLTGDGEFVFQLDYQSGFHTINQFLKECRLVSKINDATIFDEKVSIGQGQSYSVQNIGRFSNGLNSFSFWFACNNLRSFSPEQDYKAFKDTSVTLYLKQPDDNGILKITPDLFSYDPDKG